MKKRLLLFAALCLLAAASAFAQPEKDLETAIRTYNTLREYTDKLKSATLTEADVKYVGEQSDKGVALLDPIIKNQSGPVADVATYFRSTLRYEYGFVLGMKGRQRDALAVYQTIEMDVNSFTSGRFPMRYQFEGKNFIINWENFAPTQAEFNMGMCEFNYNQKNYDAALPYARKANENSYISDWNKTLSNRLVMKMKKARKEKDRELVDASLRALEGFNNLTAQNLEDGGDALAKLPDEVASTLDEVLKENPNLANGGETWVRAGRLFQQAKKTKEALNCAQKALQAGYRDRAFAEEVANQALAAGERPLALLALSQLATLTGADDCPGLSKLANLYQQAGEKSKANSYADKASACERQQQRRIRTASAEGGLYLGAYIFPLFRSDWGAVVGIQTRKLYLEASYQAISHGRDRLLDQQLKGVDGANQEKVYWDGYYAHLAINGISRKQGGRGGRPYTGVLLGYNLKEFETVQSNVSDANGQFLGTYTFEPKETRYILMLNTGFHANGRLLAGDLYFSIGGAYAEFDRGNTQFDDGGYSFDRVLLKRKDTRFSLIARVGLTVGLQFGPRTFR